MTMFVYLAGPIAGCNKSEANDWRAFVCKRLPSGVIGVSPLRCEPLIGRRYKLAYDDPRFGTPKAISAKNWFDSNRCDMVLVYLPKEISARRPSYGTVIEIGWAIAMRKPLIVVTDDPLVRDHPLIVANVPWVFDDFEPALETIEGLAMVYVGSAGVAQGSEHRASNARVEGSNPSPRSTSEE